MQLVLRLKGHEPLARDEPDEHANRERATAESETVDRIAGPPVAADELVEIQYVPLQPPAERAAEGGKIAVRRGADAIVIPRDLVRARLVERLEHAPDISFVCLRGAVAGAVGKNDDVPAGRCCCHIP